MALKQIPRRSAWSTQSQTCDVAGYLCGKYDLQSPVLEYNTQSTRRMGSGNPHNRTKGFPIGACLVLMGLGVACSTSSAQEQSSR